MRVHVELPIGSKDFTHHASAHLLLPATLRVTLEQYTETFAPEAWLSAVVRDDDGALLMEFVNPEKAALIEGARKGLKMAMEMSQESQTKQLVRDPWSCILHTDSGVLRCCRDEVRRELAKGLIEQEGVAVDCYGCGNRVTFTGAKWRVDYERAASARLVGPDVREAAEKRTQTIQHLGKGHK